MKKSIATMLLCMAALTASAQTNFEIRYAAHPTDAKHYDTERLRKDFLIEKVFAPGEINFVYSMYDRFVIGGAQPAATPLKLESIAPLKTEYFLENREMGIINIGGDGTVVVDGKNYDLKFKEALYIGRGKHQVTFSSKDASKPAKFYINSATAHTAYPIKKITMKEANVIKAGSLAGSNDRVINQLIVNGIVQTCQLQMGLTELKTGSVWNTMPAHTHLRRMETYLYFQVPENQTICHIMGEPNETRPIWLHNEQAVIAPEWSIHCAAGTSNYMFIWGMAGENLDYKDMQVVKMTDMK
ncbi:5-dehydro-4-deoxy-D-glucuronate isomerase [Hoylesella saccharolytica]|nr:5-dehydro-4-deoxy-D-glucuronate isomerase [Hoylesella saccharolytica]